MSVSIVFVRAVVGTLERSGVSRADLLARVALDSCRLDEPEARLALEDFERVLASAIALTGDEALGLHMAEQMSDMTFDLLAHLVAHAPTLREALVLDSQFAGLVIDGMRLKAHDEGDSFVIRCGFPRAGPLWDRIFAEFTIAGLARLARAFVPRAMPLHAFFEHEQPSHSGEYVRLFGNDLRFHQGETSIAFDRELADRRQVNQHPELYSLLRTEAERRLDRLGTGIRPAARLLQYLLAMSPSRIPGMASAARDLGMTERTLRRHLAEEGTSYRDVVRSALQTFAGRMLRDPARSIKETAVALGFADAAAFVRAFKRWTGTTPGDFRGGRRSHLQMRTSKNGTRAKTRVST
jgi:AraC-like DNA-binding protein